MRQVIIRQAIISMVQGWHIPTVGIIRMCMVISVLKHLLPIM